MLLTIGIWNKLLILKINIFFGFSCRVRYIPLTTFVKEVSLLLIDASYAKKQRKILVTFCYTALLPWISGVSSLILFKGYGLNGSAPLTIRLWESSRTWLFLILLGVFGKKETIEFLEIWNLLGLLWLLESKKLSRRIFFTPAPVEGMTIPSLLSRRSGILSDSGKLAGIYPFLCTKLNNIDKMFYRIPPYGMDQNQCGQGS